MEGDGGGLRSLGFPRCDAALSDHFVQYIVAALHSAFRMCREPGGPADEANQPSGFFERQIGRVLPEIFVGA